MAVYLKKNNYSQVNVIVNGKKSKGEHHPFLFVGTYKLSDDNYAYCYRILTTYEGTFIYLSNDPKVLKQHGFTITNES